MATIFLLWCSSRIILVGNCLPPLNQLSFQEFFCACEVAMSPGGKRGGAGVREAEGAVKQPASLDAAESKSTKEEAGTRSQRRDWIGGWSGSEARDKGSIRATGRSFHTTEWPCLDASLMMLKQ